MLECHVTQLAPVDLYITFQANGEDISEKQYVDLPETPGPHSISRRFTVPENKWEGNNFTCTVIQGLAGIFPSGSTGNIFGENLVSMNDN